MVQSEDDLPEYLEDDDVDTKTQGLKRIYQLAKQERPWLCMGMVFLAFSLLPVLLLPIIIGRMIDTIIDGESGFSSFSSNLPGFDDNDSSSDSGGMVISKTVNGVTVNSTIRSPADKRAEVDSLAIQLIILLTIGAFFTMLRSFVFNAAGERVVARLRVSLFGSILTQEIAMFDRRKTGELLSRLNSDTTSLQDVATSNLSMLARAIIEMVIAAILMFLTSWRLSLLIVSVVPAVVVVIVIYGRQLKRLAQLYTDALGETSNCAQEAIANIRTVRSFGAEEMEILRYRRLLGDPDDIHVRESPHVVARRLAMMKRMRENKATYTTLASEAAKDAQNVQGDSAGANAAVTRTSGGKDAQANAAVAGNTSAGVHTTREVVGRTTTGNTSGASEELEVDFEKDSEEDEEERLKTLEAIDGNSQNNVKKTKSCRCVVEDCGPQNAAICWFPPQSKSVYRYGILKQMMTAGFLAVVSLIGYGSLVLVIWFGARQVIDGNLSPGELIAFMMYAVQIGGSIGMLSGLIANIFQAMGAAERTFQLVDRQPKVPIDKDPQLVLLLQSAEERANSKSGQTHADVFAAYQGEISFTNVNFTYPSRKDAPVLKNLTLNIQKNQTVAFVGSSGAGKSSVLNLIQRFYDVDSGSIKIDGTDVKNIPHNRLHAIISWVQQEPLLFGGTVAENIAYGYAARFEDMERLPSRKDIVRAAKMSYAHAFIKKFPEGYDTLVGERGIRLSGGQKQRIAIARALLTNPRILLLDEATSALDAESEHIVQKAIESLMCNRTTLVVAHRLSTVKNADKIFLLHRHKLEAEGSHQELMTKSKRYADLVKRQLAPADSLVGISSIALGSLSGPDLKDPNDISP